MKRYLVISGIIGGVIGSLLTTLLVSPVTAQRDKFDALQCSKLEVVDATGVARVILSTDFLDTAGENIRACVIGDEYVGRVNVSGKGKGAVAMAIKEYGNGAVSTRD